MAIQILKRQDVKQVREVFDQYFSEFSLFYGRTMSDDFLERRLFSSAINTTDCSRILTLSSGKIQAVAIANFRRVPIPYNSNAIFLNLLFGSPEQGMQRGCEELIYCLLDIAAREGKAKMVTSLQWSGMWPGVILGQDDLIQTCKMTGAQCREGEVFLELDLETDLRNIPQNLGKGNDDIVIRSYRPEDGESLVLLVKNNFGIGWMHEVLSKVNVGREFFNGYGLTQLYRPQDVIVSVDRSGVCGFVIVQTLTGDDRCFFGPIGLVPTRRKQGIGTRLLYEAISLVRRAGKKKMGLWTSEVLYSGFYQQFGMRKTMETCHLEWCIEEKKDST